MADEYKAKPPSTALVAGADQNIKFTVLLKDGIILNGENMKKYGKWVKGKIEALSANEFHKRAMRSGRGVERPTAVEIDRKKNRWSVYHKPLRVGEFWD